MIDRITFSASERVNDRSALPVALKFFTAGTLTAPTTIDYTVHDADTGESKLGWTSVTPATTATITITPTTNDACRTTERREVTVSADRGLSTEFTQTFTYEIIGRLGVP